MKWTYYYLPQKLGGIFVSPVGTGDGVDCLTSPAFPKEESGVLLFVHQAPAVSIAQEKVSLLLSLCQ